MNHLSVIDQTLFPYQFRDMNMVIDSLQNNRKVLFCAMTSYGKTYSFCTVAKWHNHTAKTKVLILCFSDELVRQATATCVNIGLTVEKITASTKRMHHQADVYIAMEKTLHNRLNKDPNFIRDVGMVIIDETHVGNFDKHIEYFTTQKILGFTATPIRDKRITFWRCERCNSDHYEQVDCCGFEPMEWSRPFTMSMLYDDIVVGAPLEELFEFGSVVRDVNFTSEFTDLTNLKTDSTGEFTESSQNDAFGNSDAVFNCLLNYEQIALGKKTIIFNPSAKVNKMIYEEFKEKGYNVKLYDSVNETDSTRIETVKWFDETPDAILVNVACFTTGFDSKEVQCVILNRAIGSLSLFLQCVGRGARASDKIYKDSFIVIDGGGNIERHNRWSYPDRDWVEIFFKGIGKEKAKKESPTNVAECEDCGFLYPRSAGTCPECGHTVQPREKKEAEKGDAILVAIDNIPLPSGEKIKKYTLSRNENIHFAFKIMNSQILDLFRFNYVSRAQYINNKADGRLDERLGQIIRPVYFTLIKAEEFASDSNRTLKYVTDRVIKMLDKYYNV